MTKKKAQQPWDRWLTQGEGPKAFELFWVFLSLGSLDRTLQGVVDETGRSLALVQQLSAKFKWLARARAFDKYLIEVQLKVIESTTKADSVYFAKKEAQYRHEALGFAEQLLSKAKEMLAFPLVETHTETFTEVTVGGQTMQVPTKIIQRPQRWNLKTMVDLAEFSDKLKRLALGVPTSRAAIDVTRKTDEASGPSQNVIEAKDAMAHWITNKLDSAIARVHATSPQKSIEEIRAELLAQVPLWFADNYKVEDATALIEAVPEIAGTSAPPLELEGPDYNN